MADGMVAGFYDLFAAVRDSNGYPVGQNRTPNTKVNDTVYSPLKLLHPVNYSPHSPTRVLAERQGGQAYRGSRDLGISSIGVAQIVLDAFHEEFSALATKTVLDQATVSGWAMSSHNVQLQDPLSLILGLVKGFNNSNGNKEFITGFYHNAQVRAPMPGSSQDGGINPNPLTYEIVPDVSPRTGFGLNFSSTALDVVDDSDAYTVVRYADPICVATWVADGTEVTFTLPYKPTTSDATGGATNLVTLNGVKTAVTSIATATGLVTISAAGSAGDVWVVAFPTRFVPTS